MLGLEPQRALEPLRSRARKGRRALVEPDREAALTELDAARPELEAVSVATAERFAVFTKYPERRPAPLVKREVERAEALGVGRLRPSAVRARIMGRENRADEDDGRYGIAPAVADAVDVPPEVAPMSDGPVKPRSSAIARAQMADESAAIGTPAPGCTLPPTA